MVKQIIQWIKNHISKKESKIDERRQIIKAWLERNGIDWQSIEGILFWSSPAVSFTIYLVFSGFCWKFVSYELQRIALIILLFAGLTIVSEIRRIISQALIDRSIIEFKEENKSLGFGLNDVVDVLAKGWVLSENHFVYLTHLKDTKDPILFVIIGLYASLLLTILRYIPVIEVVFLFGTFLYFYPVFIYIGVIEKLFARLERAVQPVAVHWVNNQTKRTRNRVKNFSSARSVDTDDDEFFPRDNGTRNRVRKNIPSHENVDTETEDEFDLRGRIYKRMEDENSSDYDEDSFLPNVRRDDVSMPSMSQFDSLMEPLDDDFHAGLDFDNVTARSTSDFGIPDHLKDQLSRAGDDTDDDIDLIPAEDFPEDDPDGVTKYASVVTSLPSEGNFGHYDSVGGEKRKQQEQDFEVLEKDELKDVTDEEINEQNAGQRQSQNIIQGVTNMLGY